MIAESKSEARRLVRLKLEGVGAAMRAQQEDVVNAFLVASPLGDARIIAAYVGKAPEMSVNGLLNHRFKHKLPVALPRVVGDRLEFRIATSVHDLEHGSFGLVEPKATCPLMDGTPDVILVPGLAFDRDGNRLGRGRGFYDRALEAFDCPKIGVAFQEQVLDAIPLEDHDHRLDLVVDFEFVLNGGEIQLQT